MTATTTLIIKTRSFTVKYNDVKNKTVKTPAIKVSGLYGSANYYKEGGSSNLDIDTKTGKIKVKKDTSRGTYSIKVMLMADGNENCYSGISKTKKIKVTVR